eukprot:TRINITY_DN18448_c0_g1_i1.p1 TRINITY_DN18448_c0_g1~~TRINITY_DN18448_c0_g1_i1.p1  ORF type:complete len:249 (+),score=40.61 TRINITY_DN18448_c0_g1_i1:100-747(+)
MLHIFAWSCLLHIATAVDEPSCNDASNLLQTRQSAPCTSTTTTTTTTSTTTTSTTTTTTTTTTAIPAGCPVEPDVSCSDPAFEGADVLPDFEELKFWGEAKVYVITCTSLEKPEIVPNGNQWVVEHGRLDIDGENPSLVRMPKAPTAARCGDDSSPIVDPLRPDVNSSLVQAQYFGGEGTADVSILNLGNSTQPLRFEGYDRATVNAACGFVLLC